MIKAYTDVEQSKQLAKILPMETADMCYMEYATSDDPTLRYEGQPPMVLGDIPITEIDVVCLPCWSLAALLNVLPKPTKRIYELNIYGGDEKPFFGFNDSDLNIHKAFEGNDYIDACVNMIVYLHEQKLI